MKHYKIKQSITDRSSLSVDYYLKDIGKFPLLTEKEERLLTKEKEKNNKEAYDKLLNPISVLLFLLQSNIKERELS